MSFVEKKIKYELDGGVILEFGQDEDGDVKVLLEDGPIDRYLMLSYEDERSTIAALGFPTEPPKPSLEMKKAKRLKDGEGSLT